MNPKHLATLEFPKILDRLATYAGFSAGEEKARALTPATGLREVRRWLETGLVTPRAASLIERTMREVARRLKRMAHGWSESGAAKMTCIILKRFTNPQAWDAYWKKKLRLEGNVHWLLQEIKQAPTPLGR